MSKPKLRNRKMVVVPKGTTTIEVSFRTISRKGKIKSGSKVSIPRAAKQAVIKTKKR